MGRLKWWIALCVLAGCRVAFDPAPGEQAADQDASCEQHQDCGDGERCEEFMCTAGAEARK